jgi:hypothetical protein
MYDYQPDYRPPVHDFSKYPYRKTTRKMEQDDKPHTRPVWIVNAVEPKSNMAISFFCASGKAAVTVMDTLPVRIQSSLSKRALIDSNEAAVKSAVAFVEALKQQEAQGKPSKEDQ